MPALPSLGRSLSIQLRVIAALLMREVITRYGRHNVGFLWLFLEPMMFTLGVTGLWTVLKASHVSRLPIAAFALTGYSAVLLWRNMPSRCCGAIEPNRSLMFHRNVKVIDIFLSRLLLEVAGASASFALLSVLFIVTELVRPPEDVLLVLMGWLMLAWFGAALAILVGALSVRSELVDKIWHPLAYLIFPLSGAGFMVDWLPYSAQDAMLLVPMVHGLELLREGYFGSAVHAHHDIGYMAVCNAVLTLLGLLQLKAVTKQALPI